MSFPHLIPVRAVQLQYWVQHLQFLSFRSTVPLVFMGLLTLSPITLADGKPEAVWIDVRSYEEHSQDAISGDLNIPFNVIADEIEMEIEDKERPIKLYCVIGKRSAKAKETLENLGYKNVECIGSIEQARIARGIFPN